jgi:hypothetical protein
MTEREHQPQGWIRVRKYASIDEATAVYETARDLLFTEDLDATVFRFLLNGQSHVAVLGEIPLTEQESAFVDQAIDANGTTSEIPHAAETMLRERRRKFKRLGISYFEMREGYGPPLGG